MTPPPPRRSRPTYVGTRQEIDPEQSRPVDPEGPAGAQEPDEPEASPGVLDPGTDQPQPETDQPQPGTRGWLRPGDDVDEVLTTGGRFPDAASAAGYLGYLLDVAGVRAGVARADGDWWVVAAARLPVARELVELSGGSLYVAFDDRWCLDRGWGPPPDRHGGIGPDDRPRDRLVEHPVSDLVVAAGLRRRPAALGTSLRILVPAGRASSLLRRIADLQLVSAFRVVRLRRLFGAESGNGPASGSLIEIRLQTDPATGRRQLPAALVSALDDDHRAVVLREVCEGLLVQHDRQSALSDRQLAALVSDRQTWVVADPPFGCWSLTPLGEFADAATLMVFGPAHRLQAGDPAVVDAGSPSPLPEPVQVSVVPSRRSGGAVDAVLLRDVDLAGVRLLLEGHPLADAAFVVPGRDHHLLIASGGIGERLPLGRYLTALRPQTVYVPHGWRTDPALPQSVCAALADRVPGHAVVLDPDRTLVFDLGRRRPVWELWAGALPEIDLQLPEAASAVVTEVERAVDPWSRAEPAPAPRSPAPAATGRLRRAGHDLLGRLRTLADRNRRPVTWQQQALEAEVAGDLRRAARLHEDNGSPLAAADLYKRAALAEPGDRENG